MAIANTVTADDTHLQPLYVIFRQDIICYELPFSYVDQSVDAGEPNEPCRLLAVQIRMRSGNFDGGGAARCKV